MTVPVETDRDTGGGNRTHTVVPARIMIPRSETRKARTDTNLHPPIPPDSPHLHHDARQTDPNLAAIAAAWPTLPEPIKAAILALVQAARPAARQKPQVC